MNRTLLAFAVLLGICHCAQAAVPATMNVQGRVSVDGTNFTGTGLFKFALLGYSDAETRQATATALLTGTFVTSVNMGDGGTGYVSAPAVSFEGGGGSGAAATSTVSGGQVSGIEVTSAGSGYTSAPSVVIDPPPAPPVFETLWSNDGTGANGGEPAASVSTSVDKGLYTLLLGDTNVAGMAALPATIFESDVVFLRTWFSDGVNGFSVLSPDQKIASVPYAMQAQSVAQGSITAGMIAPESIGSNQIDWAQMPVGGWTFAEGTNVTLQSGQWLRITNEGPTTIQITTPIPHSFNARIEGSNWVVASDAAPFLEAAIPPEPPRNWSSVASSSDGMRLVATASGGKIYCSSNGGTTWKAREANRKWCAVVSSADGLKLTAADSSRTNWGSWSSGQLYSSSDGGETWQAWESNLVWSALAASADMAKVIAAEAGGYRDSTPLPGRLHIISEGGLTWNVAGRTSAWVSVASSSDGVKLIAASSGWYEYVPDTFPFGHWEKRDEPLYTSIDGGVT